MKHHTVSYLTSSKNQGLKKIFPGKPRIAVGFASCGIAAGADKVMRALEQEIKRRRLDVMLTKVGCIGYCTREPLVNVSIPGLPLAIYQHMTPEDVVPLLDAVISSKVYTHKVLCCIEQWDHITKGNVLHYGSGWQDVPRYAEVPFFSKQQKIILRNTGLINPEDIDEYIAVGGFSALHRALTTMTPEQVIEEVAAAGLRGRGGAGFPTAQKWRLARKAPGDTKYIICNADEGDPGAYMNRNEMESDPCMLLEGMIIGAYAIGAQQGIIYIREEYPLAI